VSHSQLLSFHADAWSCASKPECSSICVFCRPHGHGDVHSLLHLSGTVKTWLSKGLTHMFIFQDTNFFAPYSGIVGLGVCTQSDFDMCSLCVPRIAGEAIGGICNLKGEGKSEITINVEYNQIDAMLRGTEEFKDGDVNQPDTGFSLWPGNINELIFKLSSYDNALECSGGQVPEFVNPKYTDGTKTTFKSPTRLECMMQDFPRCVSRCTIMLSNSPRMHLAVHCFSQRFYARSRAANGTW
jgi:UDP-sugar pyrophosphorylase